MVFELRSSALASAADVSSTVPFADGCLASTDGVSVRLFSLHPAATPTARVGDESGRLAGIIDPACACLLALRQAPFGRRDIALPSAKSGDLNDFVAVEEGGAAAAARDASKSRRLIATSPLRITFEIGETSESAGELVFEIPSPELCFEGS